MEDQWTDGQKIKHEMCAQILFIPKCEGKNKKNWKSQGLDQREESQEKRPDAMKPGLWPPSASTQPATPADELSSNGSGLTEGSVPASQQAARVPQHRNTPARRGGSDRAQTEHHGAGQTQADAGQWRPGLWVISFSFRSILSAVQK